jgi:hypothetical protein
VTFMTAPVISLVCMFGLYCAQDTALYPDCTVTEVLRVHAADSFICRVAGRSILAKVRLRVQVRGVTSPADDTAGRGKEFTAAKLVGAKRIRLKNIEMRNYFRILADVDIDGAGLAAELVTNGIANAPDQPALDAQQQPKVKNTPFTRPACITGPRPQRWRVKGQCPMPPRRAVTISGLLKRTVDLSALQPSTTFADALDILRNSVEPPLPIVVLWPDIQENAFVDRTTPIGLDLVAPMPVGTALKLVLRSLGGLGELAYVIDGGIITIMTKTSAMAKTQTRVYDLAELGQHRWGSAQFSGAGQNTGSTMPNSSSR